MSISFSVIGDQLTAVALNTELEKIEAYFQEQVVNGDINTAEITKWVVRRYEGSRISSVYVMDEEWYLTSLMPEKEQSFGVHEVTYRNPYTPQTGVQSNLTMEFLGKPGPSFYWDYLEDEIVHTTPAPPDVYRYDEQLCYSYWLTVPGASTRIHVPAGCICKIRASASFVAGLNAVAEYFWNGSGGKATFETNYLVQGRPIVIRFAIVVDENPLLTGEFVNSNPNIVDENGAQASHVSWKFVKKKTSYHGTWGREDLDGSVVLVGGKDYNISLKYRLAGTVGYVTDGEGGDVFVDGIYEYDLALPNWDATYIHQPMVGAPLEEVTWVSSQLSAEFYYKYNSFVNDTSTI